MLTGTPTPFLGARHALRHDASCRLRSGMEESAASRHPLLPTLLIPTVP